MEIQDDSQNTTYRAGPNKFFDNPLPSLDDIVLQKEKKIVDVLFQVHSGNFDSVVFCYEHNLIDREWRDKDGFGILHHVVCHNRLDMLHLFMEHYQLNPNLLSSTNQTPLMLACNFGHIEIVKTLIDFGAAVNDVDQCGFNALIYAIKENHITVVIYLLSHGANIQQVDNNRCDVVHWAAYSNCLWLLRFFYKCGMELDAKDCQDLTPLERSIQNFSYDACYFFLERNPQLVYQIDVEKIESLSIQHYCTELKKQLEIQKGRFNLFWIGEIIQHNFYKILQSSKYAPLAVLYFQVLIIQINHQSFVQDTNINQSFYTELLTSLVTLYYVIVSAFFVLKIKCASQSISRKSLQEYQQVDLDDVELQQTKNQLIQGFENLDYKMISQKNFDTINRISQNDGNNTNFIHCLLVLIDQSRMNDVYNIDYQRYCPTCLQWKPPKTKHCSVTNKCIKNYNHYSYFYSKCINNTNHLQYYVMLTAQQFLLYCHIMLQLQALSGQYHQNWYLQFLETGFLLYQQNNLFNCLVFYYECVLLFYNSIYWIIETMGILRNLTFNEIFHRQRYAYLYSTIEKQGLEYTYFTNQTSYGFLDNINLWIYRCVKQKDN